MIRFYKSGRDELAFYINKPSHLRGIQFGKWMVVAISRSQIVYNHISGDRTICSRIGLVLNFRRWKFVFYTDKLQGIIPHQDNTAEYSVAG